MCISARPYQPPLGGGPGESLGRCHLHVIGWQDDDLVRCMGIGTSIDPDDLKRDYDRLVALAGVPRNRTTCATPSRRTRRRAAPASGPSARPSARPASTPCCAPTPRCCPSSAGWWPRRSAPPSSRRTPLGPAHFVATTLRGHHEALLV